MRRTPHGYNGDALTRRELREAGFETVKSRSVDSISVAPSARDVAIAHCQGTPFWNEIVARDARLLDEATDRSAQLISARFGKGGVEGRTKAWLFTTRRGA